MNENKQMSRRTARKHIFLIIYQMAFHAEFEPDFALEQIEEKMTNRIKCFIVDEVKGTIENLNKIDEIIAGYAIDWSLDRLNKIDLAIMRLAVFEIMFNKSEPIPISVSINEAVELAKTYGDDNSPAFVNGILAKVAKDANESKNIYSDPSQSIR